MSELKQLTLPTKELPQMIYIKRHEMRLSKEQVAERCRINVNTYSRIEDTGNGKLDTVLKVFNLLGIKLFIEK